MTIINRPIEFQGTPEEKLANYKTHAFIYDGDETRCMKCDSKPSHIAADYPCGADVPRENYDTATGRVKARIVLGSYVRDDHGHLGRVCAVHYGCPESDEWLAAQTLPSPKSGRWLSILVDKGGSVAMHEDRVQAIEPFALSNPSSDFYFGLTG